MVAQTQKDACFEYLAEEGYRPQVDAKGHLAFKKRSRHGEGVSYQYGLERRGEEIFVLALDGFHSLDNEECRKEAMDVALMVNGTIPVVKVVVGKKDISVRIEMLNSGPAMFERYFRGAIAKIEDAASDFLFLYLREYLDANGEIIEGMQQSEDTEEDAEENDESSEENSADEDIEEKTVAKVLVVVDPASTTEMLSLSELAQQELHARKPRILEIQGERIQVKDWADLCVKFVGWLIEHGHLGPDSPPVPNSAGHGKYFINRRPEHMVHGKDGSWREVGGVYVDIKYGASAHIKNLGAALQFLGLEDIGLRIAVQPEQ